MKIYNFQFTQNNTSFYSDLLKLPVGGLMSFWRNLCLFAHSGVQYMLFSVFVLLVFVLVYSMLHVSLDCPFYIFPSIFCKVDLLHIWFHWHKKLLKQATLLLG